MISTGHLILSTSLAHPKSSGRNSKQTQQESSRLSHVHDQHGALEFDAQQSTPQMQTPTAVIQQTATATLTCMTSTGHLILGTSRKFGKMSSAEGQCRQPGLSTRMPAAVGWAASTFCERQQQDNV